MCLLALDYILNFILLSRLRTKLLVTWLVRKQASYNNNNELVPALPAAYIIREAMTEYGVNNVTLFEGRIQAERIA